MGGGNREGSGGGVAESRHTFKKEKNSEIQYTFLFLRKYDCRTLKKGNIGSLVAGKCPTMAS